MNKIQEIQTNCTDEEISYMRKEIIYHLHQANLSFDEANKHLKMIMYFQKSLQALEEIGAS